MNINGIELEPGQYWQWQDYIISTQDHAQYTVSRVRIESDASMNIKSIGRFLTIHDAVQAARHDGETRYVKVDKNLHPGLYY